MLSAGRRRGGRGGKGGERRYRKKGRGRGWARRRGGRTGREPGSIATRRSASLGPCSIFLLRVYGFRLSRVALGRNDQRGANAPPPCCLSRRGHRLSLFSVSPKGNGAPGGARGLRGPSLAAGALVPDCRRNLA